MTRVQLIKISTEAPLLANYPIYTVTAYTELCMPTYTYIYIHIRSGGTIPLFGWGKAAVKGKVWRINKVKSTEKFLNILSIDITCKYQY